MNQVVPFYEAESIEALLLNMPADIDERLDVHGCVYVFEVGNAVKIGCTSDVRSRLSGWRAMYRNIATSLGRVAVTIPHINAGLTEKDLHSTFAPQAIRKEFFAVSFDAVLKEISGLPLQVPSVDDLERLRKIQDEKHARILSAFTNIRENLYGRRTTDFDGDMVHTLLDNLSELSALPWVVWIIKDYEDWFGLIKTDLAIELGRSCAALACAEPSLSRQEVFDAITDKFHEEYLAA